MEVSASSNSMDVKFYGENSFRNIFLPADKEDYEESNCYQLKNKVYRISAVEHFIISVLSLNDELCIFSLWSVVLDHETMQ